jgi:TRAP-type uncharacterized transport system fused permease subunit
MNNLLTKYLGSAVIYGFFLVVNVLLYRLLRVITFVPDTSVLFIAYGFLNDISNSTVRCQMAGLSMNNIFQRKWESDRGLIWYYVAKFDGRDLRNHENSQS